MDPRGVSRGGGSRIDSALKALGPFPSHVWHRQDYGFVAMPAPGRSFLAVLVRVFPAVGVPLPP